MWAEQAVFTSLPRRGRGGYHLVSRSRGVDEADAQALARWAPSHGALIVDGNNRTSVNFHPLPSGRFALSRTCAGPPEYSGRGGHQLYTHFLIVDDAALESVGFQPFSIYRDAMALGYLLYQPDPNEVLEPVRLSQLHPRRDAGFWADRAGELGLPPPRLVVDRLQSGHPLRFAYSGDRIALAECLIGMLSPEVVRTYQLRHQPRPLLGASIRPFTWSVRISNSTFDRWRAHTSGCFGGRLPSFAVMSFQEPPTTASSRPPRIRGQSWLNAGRELILARGVPGEIGGRSRKTSDRPDRPAPTNSSIPFKITGVLGVDDVPPSPEVDDAGGEAHPRWPARHGHRRASGIPR